MKLLTLTDLTRRPHWMIVRLMKEYRVRQRHVAMEVGTSTASVHLTIARKVKAHGRLAVSQALAERVWWILLRELNLAIARTEKATKKNEQVAASVLSSGSEAEK